MKEQFGPPMCRNNGGIESAKTGAKRVNKPGHVFRQRRVEMDIFSGDRMAESERCGVQCLARERVDEFCQTAGQEF